MSLGHLIKMRATHQPQQRAKCIRVRSTNINRHTTSVKERESEVDGHKMMWLGGKIFIWLVRRCRMNWQSEGMGEGGGTTRWILLNP